MARKMDPSVKVQQYFEEQPLAQAEQALALAKYTVSKRREALEAQAGEAKGRKVARRKAVRKPKLATATSPADAATAATAPAAALRPRKMAAGPAAGTE